MAQDSIAANGILSIDQKNATIVKKKVQRSFTHKGNNAHYAL